MNNENTTASQMQHPELSAKNNVNLDATDTTVEIATLSVRITHLESLNTLLHEQIQRLREQNFAFNDEAKELRETVNDLTAWSEGVEDDNDTLRKEIARLKEERDSARWEVCELSGNGSIDSASRVADERGWDLTDEDEVFTYICDHCGDPVDSDNVFFFHTLPQDIASANKGESATTCRKCFEMIDANANNQDFRTTDMG